MARLYISAIFSLVLFLFHIYVIFRSRRTWWIWTRNAPAASAQRQQRQHGRPQRPLRGPLPAPRPHGRRRHSRTESRTSLPSGPDPPVAGLHAGPFLFQRHVGGSRCRRRLTSNENAAATNRPSAHPRGNRTAGRHCQNIMICVIFDRKKV